MKTIFGYPINNVFLISGTLVLILCFIILIIGIIKVNLARRDREKTVKDIDSIHNRYVIYAAVLFAFAVVLLVMSLITTLRSSKQGYEPPATPEPSVTNDEQFIDNKLREGWFLQPEESNITDPSKDPCVINKDNLAAWGLKRSTNNDCDGEEWLLRKNKKTYKRNDENTRTVNYRGLRVEINDNAPGIGKPSTKSPPFYSEQ